MSCQSPADKAKIFLRSWWAYQYSEKQAKPKNYIMATNKLGTSLPVTFRTRKISKARSNHIRFSKGISILELIQSAVIPNYALSSLRIWPKIFPMSDQKSKWWIHFVKISFPAFFQVEQTYFHSSSKFEVILMWGASHPGWPQKGLIGNSPFNIKT